MSSCDMPTTVAPMAAKRGVASAKAWASMVQPWVKALGKKYSTTGPFLSVAAMSKSKALPATAAGVVKRDRKSTRLNSSHSQISYAVFCLKKKKKTNNHLRRENDRNLSRVKFQLRSSASETITCRCAKCRRWLHIFHSGIYSS